MPRELCVTPDRDERLLAQAERLDRDAATRLLDLLAVGLEAMKNGADARTQLELALVKAAAPDVDASTRALLARLDRLERQLAGGDAEVVVEKAPAPAPPPVPKAGAAVAAAAPAPTVAVAEQPAGELGVGRRAVAGGHGDDPQRERPAGRRAGAGPPDPGRRRPGDRLSRPRPRSSSAKPRRTSGAPR